MRRIFIVSFALLLCTTLAKGEGPPPRGYTAEFHARIEYKKEDRNWYNTNTVTAEPSFDTDGFLPALERARQVFLAVQDRRGRASVDLTMIGPKSRYSTSGSGDSLHAAIEDAVRQAKEDLKK